ncbi:hypothetical protein GE09DRAFT_1214011 [Coniochaeta sp. 2T2.1]|nr:hypothetical protein GE09DRAFT_1214011 [Coniochaeta sp. 2T2.1]
MSDPPDRPNTAQTFTLFPDLPTELRLQIWRASCVPRVVTVSWDIPTSTYRTHLTTVPAILHVNRESRSEALSRVYTSFFTPRPVYFAPDLDTLYIARNRHFGYADPVRNVAHNLKFAPSFVRSLAVDHVAVTERKEWETYSKWCLFKAFPQLEEAYLVMGGLERDEYLRREKEREGLRGEQRQTVELVLPRAGGSIASKELEDFVETWMYDLAGQPQTGVNDDDEEEDEGERNKFLETILHARRGDQWKSLWKCREAHVTVYGTESEWWSTQRKSDLGWVDVVDGTVYQTKNGVRYYRKSNGASAHGMMV